MYLYQGIPYWVMGEGEREGVPSPAKNLVTVVLILIDIQYLENVAFSFKKGSNGQNLSFSVFH